MTRRSPPRAVGLDAGAVRVGLAAADATGVIATPLVSLHRRRHGDLWRRLQSEVESRATEIVIVGLPRRLDGTEGDAAHQARMFATEVGERLRLPVELWDEWLTTVQAERALIASGIRRARRRETIDAVAAALMLQNWLDAWR